MKKENIVYWHKIFLNNKLLVVDNAKYIVIYYNHYDQTIYYLQKQNHQQDDYFVYQDIIFDCTTIHEMNIEDFVNNFELDKSKKYHFLNEENQEKLITLLYKNVIVNDNFCVKKIFIEELNNKKLIAYSKYNYVSDSYLKRILGHLKQPHLLKQTRDELSKQVGVNLVNTKGSYGNMVAIVNRLFEHCNQQTQKRILQKVNKGLSL